MTPFVRLIAIATLSASLTAATQPLQPAYADKAADKSAIKRSKQHFELGEKLFALGRFDAALEEYEKAYEANPLPAFLFNIGQCHRNLGHFQQAAFSFRSFLHEAPNSEQREAVEALIVELDEKQREAEERERQPTPLVTPPPAAVIAPTPRTQPIYSRWWFWGGVAAIAGASAGTYVLLRNDDTPTTDLGNVVFH